jgi:predicted HTH transcriptional regulator
MSLPSFPESLTKGSTFPYVEGPQWEFKHIYTESGNVSKPMLDKIKFNVCGFLNGTGGYMVFGVNDDGIVVGITRKAVDKISLYVDSMFVTSVIVNTTIGGRITPDEITSIVIPLDDNAHILAIKVVSKNLNHIYRLSDGAIVYRMCASTVITNKNTFRNEYDMKKLREERDELREEVMKYRATVTLTEVKSASRMNVLNTVKSLNSKLESQSSMITKLRSTNDALTIDLKKCMAELEAAKAELAALKA